MPCALLSVRQCADPPLRASLLRIQSRKRLAFYEAADSSAYDVRNFLPKWRGWEGARADFGSRVHDREGEGAPTLLRPCRSRRSSRNDRSLLEALDREPGITYLPMAANLPRASTKTLNVRGNGVEVRGCACQAAAPTTSDPHKRPIRLESSSSGVPKKPLRWLSQSWCSYDSSVPASATTAPSP